MIFVTVGTHEQQFNRLIKYIDKMKKDRIITEEIFIQTGFSTYQPEFCKWRNMIPYSEMLEYVKRARIVITHGGPSSFIMPLQEKKIPIVVPRQKQFDEHINDHQVDFCAAVAERQGNIISVLDINDLCDTILNYDIIVDKMKNNITSNNKAFNDQLNIIVREMFEG